MRRSPSIIVHRFPGICPAGLVIMLAAFLTSLACVNGCGSNGAGSEDPLLIGVQSSKWLSPQLRAGYQHLAEADGSDPQVRRDLAIYDEIQQNLYDSRLRASAVDSFFSLWQAQPDHVLWPVLAATGHRALRQDSRYGEMFAHPACSDTSTAIGIYTQGWRLQTVPAFMTHFRAAYQCSGELDPFPELWIALIAAYAERLDGNLNRALDIALSILPQSRAVGGKRLEAKIWKEIAKNRMAQGDLDDALHAASLAEALTSAAIGDGDAIVGLLEIRELKANVLAARRNIEVPFYLYDYNVSDALDLNLNYYAARNLNRAGIHAEVIGRRDLGLKYCQRSLDLVLSERDSFNVPGLMMNIAHRFRMQGDLDSCFVYQKRAEPWATAYGHPQMMAQMPSLQAEYYAQVGQFDVVDSLLSAAVDLAVDDDLADVQADLHLQLIRGWMETGRPDLVYRSIAILSELRTNPGDELADRHVIADLNLLAGEFFTRRGEYAQAKASLDLAAAEVDRRPSAQRAWSLARNRGRLARTRGSLRAAAEQFQSCIDLGIEAKTPELESTGRFLLGSVLLAEERFAEARTTFPSTDASEFVGRFTTRVSALLLIGISHAREGNHSLALATLAEARGACRSWSPLHLLARIDLETGRSMAGTGNTTAAMDLYRDIADRLSAQLDTDAVAANPELAFFNGDLRRDLVEAIISLPDIEPGESLRLARRVLPRWRSNSETQIEHLAFPQLIYFVGKEKSGRWYVNRDAVQWSPVPNEQVLNTLVAPVLADMSSPGRAMATADVQRLADTLLKDVGGSWPQGQVLSIVPDLALYRVPWAALPLSGESGMVLDHGPVAILDQPTSELNAEQVHEPTGKLLVVGADETTGGFSGELKKLRHAEAEAHDLYETWPENQATLRVGEAAGLAFTDGAALATYEAIHVASHATVLEGVSEQTMLLLAGEGSEPLTAKAIRKLDLDAELVFLSSCEAGDGQGTRSGYAGLARSFLDAGARTVIAPLIVVDDEAARGLAARFYAHWLAGETVPVALHLAQRDLRDSGPQWAHPFFWAFYQPMIGGTRTSTR